MDKIHENLKLKEPNCTFRHQGTIKKTHCSPTVQSTLALSVGESIIGLR
jgi:hypothetical protein